MKTRISFVGLITAGLLLASLAQAEGTLSIEETYSGALPGAARDDLGLGSYYVAPLAARKPTCGWRAAQYDLDPLRVVYADATDSGHDLGGYLAASNVQLVCKSAASRS